MAHRFWWAIPLALYIWATLQVSFIGASSLHILRDLSTDYDISGYAILFNQGSSWGDLVSLWDGQWYRSIVEWGYQVNYSLEEGISKGYLTNWAFFPLYPTIIGVITGLEIPFWLAGSAISITCSLVGIIIIFRVAYTHSKSLWLSTFSIVTILASPSFFIMQSTYTEGVSILLLALVLYGLTSKKYLFALIGIVLIGFTRGLGIPLLALIIGYLAFEFYKTKKFPKSSLFLLPAAIFAAVFWPLFVGYNLGSLTASLDLLTLWTTAEKYPLWVPLLAVISVFLLQFKMKLPWEWKLWSLIYIVYITVTTVMSTGLIRYAMLALIPVPLFFSKLKPKHKAIANGMLLFIIFMVGAYAQLWWFTSVWIPTSTEARWSYSIP